MFDYAPNPYIGMGLQAQPIDLAPIPQTPHQGGVMGQVQSGNFLNSPGGSILHALGVNMPQQQQQQSQWIAPVPFQPGPVINPSAPPPPLPDATPGQIPKPPHGGLFHRIASAMLGGM